MQTIFNDRRYFEITVFKKLSVDQTRLVMFCCFLFLSLFSAYTVRIRKLTSVTRTAPIKCYSATLKRWPLANSQEKGYSSSKCIPIDKYSPKRQLSDKIFAVLTDHDYRDDLDFYLDQWKTEKETLVFKGPRERRKFRKSLKKIQRKCQKRNSKTLNKIIIIIRNTVNF